MAKKTTTTEALHGLLLAMLDPPSMRTKTRIIRRLFDFRDALENQGCPEPHEVMEVLSEFSLSRTIGD